MPIIIEAKSSRIGDNHFDEKLIGEIEIDIFLLNKQSYLT